MNQSIVGIIANPSSGKDVRRITSHAATVTNLEKVMILKRVLTGMAAAGVRWVVYMPDPKDLVGHAYKSLQNISVSVNPINMAINGNEKDTLEATARMLKMGVSAIVTLGGDGTNRLVAKQTNKIPLIPISTGTNNIFPDFIEGTKAGFTAGIVARFSVNGTSIKQLFNKNKILKIECDGLHESALIDVAISEDKYLGGRALWKPNLLKHIFVTRAFPGEIGISGIVGSVMEIKWNDNFGGYVKIGTEHFVKSIITSGSVTEVGIHSYEKMEIGKSYNIFVEEGSLYADGESIFSINKKNVTVTLDSNGPLVVNIPAILSLAREKNVFSNKNEI